MSIGRTHTRKPEQNEVLIRIDHAAVNFPDLLWVTAPDFAAQHDEASGLLRRMECPAPDAGNQSWLLNSPGRTPLLKCNLGASERASKGCLIWIKADSLIAPNHARKENN